VLTKNKKMIFGGYTDISWQLSGEEKQGKGNSFIFSLRDDENFVKLKSLKKEIEVYHDPCFMSDFGKGQGFWICDDCNVESESYSNIGENYEAPKGI
jgi:hypothetical protein